MKRKYGLRWQKSDKRDLLYTPHAKLLADRPVMVNLRDQMPAIYDQENIGSCTAQSVCALMEYLNMKQGDIFEPSRLYTYYNNRVMMGWWYLFIDSGATIRDSIKSVAKYGICAESLWPYDTKKYWRTPPAKAYADGKKQQALQYEAVVNLHEHIETRLAEGFPVDLGIPIYTSFQSEAAAKTGVVPMPVPATETLLGGHAVLCIGYDRDKQIYYMRNSWGEEWGDKGYFTIPYQYMKELASDLWTITLVE